MPSSSNQHFGYGSRPSPGRQLTLLQSALLAQAHDHVDARDLVALGHVGHLREHEMRVGYIDQLVIVLEIEVMMRRYIGVEIGLCAVDADLTQQTGIGELVERVVDGR